MNRSCGIGVVLAVIVLFGVYAVLGVLYLPKFLNFIRSPFRNNTSAYAQRLIPKTVPKAMPADTLAVFNFRHSGEGDARLYAIGFARAIADRINFAPECITQQPTVPQLSDTICACKLDYKLPLSDESAAKVGMKLYVRYILTGDFKLSGEKASISAYLIDLSGASKKASITGECALSELPSMQSKVVMQMVKLMKLSPDSSQLIELQKANFTKPDVLKLYGRSVLTDDIKEVESCRWKAVQQDPNSTFAAVRLLEFNCYGPPTASEIRSNNRLQSFIDQTVERNPHNTHIGIMKGLLLAKQFEYQHAQKVLEQVAEHDPGCTRVHCALHSIGQWRQDAALSVREAKIFVNMWPNNADYHAWLAEAYDLAANSARRGHYFGEMSASREREWKQNCEDCFTEAMTAIKLNPDCYYAWRKVMASSLQLSFYGYRDKAYKEMVRIDPKNSDAYSDYLICFTPQWGGSVREQEAILAQAEKAMGRDSVNMCFLRADMMRFNNDLNTADGRPNEANRNELLQLANKAQSLCKSPDGNVMLFKCRSLRGAHHEAEFAILSKQGFEKWGTSDWHYQYAAGCALRYENAHDIGALNTAKILFEKYANEIPFDPDAYIQWGWCMSHLGHRAEAKKLFEKALELDPANDTANEKMKYVQ